MTLLDKRPSEFSLKKHLNRLNGPSPTVIESPSLRQHSRRIIFQDKGAEIGSEGALDCLFSRLVQVFSIHSVPAN